MSRFSAPVAVKWLAFLVGGACCVFAGLAIQRILTVDPLKRFKSPLTANENVGIEMTNFDWKAYNGATLVATAHVQKATVGRDRDQVQLTAVSNGKYYEAGKVAFGFEADNAVYFDDLDALTGAGKARVFNEQLDVSTTKFQFDPEKKSLVVPAQISGKLQGGDVKAGTLTYKLDDKSFELTTVKWSGMVAQDDTKRTWSFTGPDGKSGTTVKGRGPVTTYGKLKATDGEVIILADSAEYNKDTDVLTAKGNVKYYGPDANMVCNEVVLYRKERHAILTGSVDMLVKPKQDGKAEEVTIPPVVPVVPETIAKERPAAPPVDTKNTDQEKQVRNGSNIRDYPVAVTASKIEYWYKKGEKRAVITGSPQARQELPSGAWRMVWAESGFYDGEKETLQLKSKADKQDVRMLNSLGDDMTATSVLVSTKEGDDMLDAENASATVKISESELPEKVKKDDDKKGGGTPPPISGPIGKRGR